MKLKYSKLLCSKYLERGRCKVEKLACGKNEIIELKNVLKRFTEFLEFTGTTNYANHREELGVNVLPVCCLCFKTSQAWCET